MFADRKNIFITAGLLLAILVWGGNNVAMQFLLKFWPPFLVGGTRFLCSGLLILALLRWTDFMGKPSPLSEDLKRRLWSRGALILALYVILFNWALCFTSASHVALYFGGTPVLALLWEGRGGVGLNTLIKRFGAAALAMTGVIILLWPALQSHSGTWPGELFGLAASAVWVAYGRECRVLGQHLSGAEITAQTMWRAGVFLLPFSLLEMNRRSVPFDGKLVAIQIYGIVASGVVGFACWNHALRHWKTSKVYLFNNLIPACTMLWAYFCLGEPLTPTFGFAMLFIASGVLVGQADWQKLFGNRWVPIE